DETRLAVDERLFQIFDPDFIRRALGQPPGRIAIRAGGKRHSHPPVEPGDGLAENPHIHLGPFTAKSESIWYAGKAEIFGLAVRQYHGAGAGRGALSNMWVMKAHDRARVKVEFVLYMAN